MREHFKLGYNRTHGAAAQMRELADSARGAAFVAVSEGREMFAASLRGKAKAYDECAQIVEALDRDRRLPRFRRLREQKVEESTP